MVAQGEAEAPGGSPSRPGCSQGEQCGCCHSCLSGKPPERAGGGWLCRWVSSMEIAFLSAARQGGGRSQCWAVGADVVGTAVDRYLAAGLDPMDWWPMRAGSQRVPSTGWPWRCARLATCLCARWSAPPYCRVEVVPRNVHLQHEGHEGLDLGPLDIHAPARTAARLHQVSASRSSMASV